MAKFDLASLTCPISDQEPCGPDLDETSDPDYLNFMATAEGLIPASFLVQAEDSTGKMVQKPFWERSDERENVNFAAWLPAAGLLTARTRDLRLMAILAKFCILDKDLRGFQVCLEAIAVLLDEQWGSVHPRGADGNFSMRAVVLGTLDDRDPVVLPLRFYPLVEHKNLGTITYRNYMAATGQVAADSDRAALASIERALKDDADLAQLITIRDTLEGIHKALTRIENVCAERLGLGVVKLEALPRLVNQIRTLLEMVIVARDPAATAAGLVTPQDDMAGPLNATPQSSPENISTAEEAASALAVAAEYFSRSEPSNPALLLIRHAQALIGKSFFEAMQLLLPTQIQNAALRIGSGIILDLPLERLASGNSKPAAIQEAGLNEPPSANASHRRVPEARLTAGSRHEAIALLDQVGAYFRIAEPSSPVPLLTDRARNLSGKDFIGLLGDVLPKQ